MNDQGSTSSSGKDLHAAASRLGESNKRPHLCRAGQSIRIQNNGLGIQSTTIFLMSHEGLIAPLDHSIFADTQDEPSEVYDHLAWLRTVPAPVPLIHVGTAGCLGDDLTTGKNSTGQRFVSIPAYTAPTVREEGWREGMVRRQCTKEYKVEVVERIIRQVILGLKPRQHRPKNVEITQVFGISWDERSRSVNIEKRYTEAGWKVEFPLIDRRMTRQDCKDFLKPRVPHETPRSACVYCPFKSADEWLRTKADPKAWARARQIDNGLRTGVVLHRSFDQQLFLHRSCLPLDQIDFEALAKKEADRVSLPLFEMADWNIEPIPDDCLPPQDVIDKLLRGPEVDPDGKIVGGTWDGMTQAEVMADYEAYRRICGD